jgi:hypothetical protein
MSDSPDTHISASECFKLYRKGAHWLRTKEIPSRLDESTGVALWETSKILEALDAGDGEKSHTKELAERDVVSEVAGNVKESANMLRQVHAHLERMFTAHEKASQTLYKTLIDHVQQQNEHVIQLEAQALEMRAVTERAMSLEHERKLAEKEVDRRGVMQEKALGVMKETLLPWFQQKLTNGAPAAESGAAQVGKFTIQVLSSLSDENFAEMVKTLPSEVGTALSALRTSVKEGAIST